ncbi:MAG: RNA methyltransferase, partial [Clostridia bacterium]|nr:RNA methyltransferase [Clostridia bacterium]
RLIARAGDVLMVGDSAFRFLADTVTPQGIGAVLEFPTMPSLSEVLRKATRLLILENLQDPGNLGTCIRTADAFGFDAVLCVSDCVDAYNPKVLRSTVGSMFHIPVLRIEENISTLLERVKGDGFAVYGAHPRGGAKAGDESLFTGKSAVIIGNEGAGLTEAAKRGSDCLVTIPMPGRAESLNAGIAASVLMYEVIRRKEDER